MKKLSLFDLADLIAKTENKEKVIAIQKEIYSRLDLDSMRSILASHYDQKNQMFRMILIDNVIDNIFNIVEELNSKDLELSIDNMMSLDMYLLIQYQSNFDYIYEICDCTSVNDDREEEFYNLIDNDNNLHSQIFKTLTCNMLFIIYFEYYLNHQ